MYMGCKQMGEFTVPDFREHGMTSWLFNQVPKSHIRWLAYESVHDGVVMSGIVDKIQEL
jgi:hypothetical protein